MMDVFGKIQPAISVLYQGARLLVRPRFGLAMFVLFTFLFFQLNTSSALFSDPEHTIDNAMASAKLELLVTQSEQDSSTYSVDPVATVSATVSLGDSIPFTYRQLQQNVEGNPEVCQALQLQTSYVHNEEDVETYTGAYTGFTHNSDFSMTNFSLPDNWYTGAETESLEHAWTYQFSIDPFIASLITTETTCTIVIGYDAVPRGIQSDAGWLDHKEITFSVVLPATEEDEDDDDVDPDPDVTPTPTPTLTPTPTITPDPTPTIVPTKIMPLGDSITQGYITADNITGGYRIKLEDLLENIDFVGSQQNGIAELTDKDHEGHGGWSVDEIRNYVEGWLDAEDPDIILLMAGANDVLREGQFDLTETELNQLLEIIFAEEPNATVLLSTLTPIDKPGAGPMVDDLNQFIREIVPIKQGEGKKIELVDMYPALTVADLADDVHPTQAGYDKMAVVWAEAITKVRNKAVVINEVYQDGSNEWEWVELYNNSSVPVSVKNWKIADNSGSDTLPDVTIDPQGFGVILTDSPTDGVLNTVNDLGAKLIQLGNSAVGNGLNTTGDELILTDNLLQEIDALSWGNNTTVFTMGNIPTGKSYARSIVGVDTDSASDWQILDTPNPGTNPHSHIIAMAEFIKDKVVLTFQRAFGFTRVQYAISYTHLRDGEQVQEQIIGEKDKDLKDAEMIIDENYLGTCSFFNLMCTPHQNIQDITVELLFKNGSEILGSRTINIEDN